MRKKIIIGNWKMNKNINETKEFINNIKKEVTAFQNPNLEFGIAPTFLTIIEAKKLAPNNLIIAAQDAHFESSGAFTGNVSYKQLKDENINYVIIGHSERRAMFNDSDEVINKKLNALLTNNMVPILCIGETLKEYENNKTKDVLSKQLEANLCGIDVNLLDKLIIAYEPIWAIGTGKTATASQAQEVIKFIRQYLAKLANNEIASKVRIQYGGSVKPSNIKELLQQDDIDGALVGGASLVAKDFLALIKGI